MWLLLLLLILPRFSGGFLSDKEINWLTENGVQKTMSGKSGCFSKNSTIQSSFTSLANLVDKCDGEDNSPFVYRFTREELRKRSIDSEDFYCVFPEEDDDLVSVFVCNPRDFCSNGNPCIRKCCGPNQKLVETPDIYAPAVCEPYNKTINVSFHTRKETPYPTPVKVSAYGIFLGQPCLKILVEEDPKSYFFDSETGNLHMIQTDPVTQDRFCVDFFEMNGITTQNTFGCLDTEFVRERDFYAYGVALCISSMFLIATILVYGCSPKLLNLHGKTLICHLMSLLFTYGGLAYIHYFVEIRHDYCLGSDHPENATASDACPDCLNCVETGFRIRCAMYMPGLPGPVGLFTYASFNAAFTWLNVMCFDIWWTCRTRPQPNILKGPIERKRFLIYSLYGWLIPIILTLSISFIRTHDLIVTKVLPQYLLFLLPMGFIFAMNFVFFFLTTLNVNRVKRDIRRRQSLDSGGSRRMWEERSHSKMIWKLSWVMGLGWCLEFLTTIWRNELLLWIITDFYNVLHGWFVFMIFAFKWPVIFDLHRRLRDGVRGLANSFPCL